jgi:hypothetical protein
MIYDPDVNSRRGYDLAISKMREAYLRERRDGESANQWMERTRADAKRTNKTSE